MLFCPKNSKFKKYQKGIFPNRLHNNNLLVQNKTNRTVKLIANAFGDISSKQLLAIRFLIRKFIKKRALVHFKTFPHRAITKKPLEIRMGKGKGGFSHWSASLKQGSAICEIFCSNLYKFKILKLLKRVQIRLPIKTLIRF